MAFGDITWKEAEGNFSLSAGQRPATLIFSVSISP